MRRFDLEGIKLDRCVVCAGIWVDAGELEALLGLGRDGKRDLHAFDHGAGQGYVEDVSPRICPRDGAVLTPVRDEVHPEIEYDVCPECGGIFFDSGELAGLSRLTLRERLARMLGR